MTIRFKCLECDKGYSLGDEFAGKRVKCKACGSVFQVSAPVSALSPDDFLRELSEESKRQDFVSAEEVCDEDFQFAHVGAKEQSEVVIDPEPRPRPSSRREQTRPSAPDPPRTIAMEILIGTAFSTTVVPLDSVRCINFRMT